MNLGNDSCTKKGRLSCRDGHPRCYSIESICVFRLDYLNHLFPCRTGAHLASCETFECNGMYKCPKSYCIPWGYTCDGKADCQYGQDEENCNSRVCDNKFTCRQNVKCLDVEDLCDGFFDCPYGEDETLCDLKDFPCPSLCVCHLYSISCAEINTNTRVCSHIIARSKCMMWTQKGSRNDIFVDHPLPIVFMIILPLNSYFKQVDWRVFWQFKAELQRYVAKARLFKMSSARTCFQARP